jgi:uncharacterized protein YbjQ (UPF0145 family)
MFFSTTSDYDTSKYDIAGIVYSTHVEAISAFRSIAASFGAMFGDKSGMITKKLYDAHKGAFEELMKNTIVRYPEAVGVVGVKTELSEINLGAEGSSGLIAIIVTGTAVVPKGTKMPTKGTTKGTTKGGQRFDMKPHTTASRTRKNRKMH